MYREIDSYPGIATKSNNNQYYPVKPNSSKKLKKSKLEKKVEENKKNKLEKTKVQIKEKEEEKEYIKEKEEYLEKTNKKTNEFKNDFSVNVELYQGRKGVIPGEALTSKEIDNLYENGKPKCGYLRRPHSFNGKYTGLCALTHNFGLCEHPQSLNDPKKENCPLYIDFKKRAIEYNNKKILEEKIRSEKLSISELEKEKYIVKN